MNLPPAYMNYGQPQRVSYVQQPQRVSYIQPRVEYVQPQRVAYSYRPSYIAQPVQQPVVVKEVKPVRAQRSLVSLFPLWIIRFLLILACIGTFIAAALARNKKFGTGDQSFYSQVWISTLVFSCVGFGACFLFFILLVTPVALKAYPLVLLAGLFDLLWSPAMIILGSFCAHREKQLDAQRFNILTNPTGILSSVFAGINRGALGSAAAFALLAGVLFFFSFLLHVIYALKIKKSRAIVNSV